jgi:chromosome segregation ATPase
MPSDTARKIKSLQEQLEELKVIYEEMTSQQRTSKSLTAIKNQIDQLQRAIQALASK